MKKKVVLMLAILTLTGCGYDEYEMPELANIAVNNLEIEVFEPGKLYDLIGENNVEILTEDKELDTDSIGKKKETIEYKYENKKYKYDLSYTVVDKTKPVFINAASIRNIVVNQDYYPCDEIVFGDNLDRTPTCEIAGEYDLTQVGTYNVEYVIKDQSENEERKNLKINVVDSISPSSNSTSTKTTLPFSDVIAKHKNESTSIGIDVSRWQTDIDFSAVKNAGAEFVIMRIGVNSDIDKDLSVDSYYEKNIANAKAAGLKVGVYVYTSAINDETAKEHAEWVVNTLNGTELDFPIVFDWENWSKFRKYGISIHDLDHAFETFYETVNKHGYDAMLYSSKFYLEKVWMNKKKHPVWLAHYTSNTDYQGDYIIWQMSNVGRIDGINGDVDIDILYNK